MIERIDKYIAKSSVIKIYTDVEDDTDEYHGIPIKRSSTLLAFHVLSEFHFYAIKIVRLKDIVRIRRGRFETIQQKILKEIGELDNHVGPSWLRVGSWKSLLTCLKSKGLCACVSSALIDVNTFYIGEIYSFKEDAAVLSSFDAHGKWHKPRRRINFFDITEVSFGDEYSVVFNEFVKSRR